MDKTEIAQSWYDRGVRAYERDGKPITQTQEKIVLEIMSVSALACWYELRRIQDEERKNGVPIEWSGSDAEWPVINKWLNQDYEAGDYLYRYCVGGTIKSDTKTPEIMVFGRDRYRIAAFTNFRWRAGYTKGGQRG